VAESKLGINNHERNTLAGINIKSIKDSQNMGIGENNGTFEYRRERIARDQVAATLWIDSGSKTERVHAGSIMCDEKKRREQAQAKVQEKYSRERYTLSKPRIHSRGGAIQMAFQERKVSRRLGEEMLRTAVKFWGLLTSSANGMDSILKLPRRFLLDLYRNLASIDSS
jgi:hypothetical protein